MGYCDVVMGNIWAADTFLGIPVKENIPVNRAAYMEQAFQSSAAILSKFPKCKSVANTFRFDNKGIRYYASLFTEEVLYYFGEFTCERVVDKIGSGDCFMAALIYGFRRQHSPEYIIDFAAAAAFGKLQEKGDATQQRIEQIEQRV